MEYRIYIFLVNHKYLKDVFKKDIDFQFENIKDYFKAELGSISDAEFVKDDFKSIIFKNRGKNDFKSVYELAGSAESLVIRLRSLMKDFENEILIKIGIILKEEVTRRHPFRWNLPYELSKKVPNILLSDKTALSVIENYEVKDSGLRNIWTTDGEEFSRSKKIRNIYFDREESDDIREFINSLGKEQILYIYGEKGSGKTTVIKDILNDQDPGKFIIHIWERKHSAREFRTIHELIYHLLFITGSKEPLPHEEVMWKIENSNLPSINKNNLEYFCRNIFSENTLENDILFDYGSYRENIRKALNDVIRLTRRKFTVIIDNHQWMSKNCEEILFDVIKENTAENKIVFVSDDKNNSNNICYPVKYLRISDLNKVQVSKILKLTFPRTKFSTKTADFIHKATAGNLYTILEFLQYMLDKEYLVIKNGKLDIVMSDLSLIPDNLSDIYSERINSLSENASSLFKIISIIGDRFFFSDLDWLLHILNYPHDESEALKELEEKGLIENAGDYYNVTEPSVTDEIYKTVNPRNRQLIHKLLAELFETKGYDDFGFKIFIHYYRSGYYEKLIALLPEIRSVMHKNLNFNALKNLFEISDKLLFKICLKENLFPVEEWINNMISSKWLFDINDPISHIQRLEKAIDHLIKIEKKEYSLKLFEILLDFYIRSGKSKKFEQYFKTGLEIALESGSEQVIFKLSVLNLTALLFAGKPAEPDEFRKLASVAAEVPEFTEDGNFIFLKAHYLETGDEHHDAADLLKKLLETQISRLDFFGIEKTAGKLTSILMKIRDYKQAEEYLKYMLQLKKENSPDDAMEINIILAKIYSYQNKFLQSISMIESLISNTSNPEIIVPLKYTLGSIYQFYNEKEMAFKTFETILKSIKNKRSEKYYVVSLKTALARAYFEDFGEAENYIQKLKKTPFRNLVGKIFSIESGKADDKNIEVAVKDFQKNNFPEKTDLVFEAGLIFLNILMRKRKNDKCLEMIEALRKMEETIEDYNMLLSFKKLSKDIVRKSNKPQKKLSPSKKMSASVKKRVSRRRTI
ncbi:MAG: hypothetical protein JXN63_07920 [Candidatus Delongbacteria bacterium]|nr:hypothetical protein [Candidatus Delongbacteria bacterium]